MAKLGARLDAKLAMTARSSAAGCAAADWSASEVVLPTV
jgi:hypothetical protein